MTSVVSKCFVHGKSAEKGSLAKPPPGQTPECATDAQKLRQGHRFRVFSGLGSEECNPLNMSIEAELVIGQMKEQHDRDLCHLRQELEEKVSSASPARSLTAESCPRAHGRFCS